MDRPKIDRLPTVSQTSEIRNARAESFRVPIDCPVDLRHEDAEWTRRTATNISMSGMFIRTAEVHSQGTELEVKFELQNGQPAIQGRAEVLWCRARDAGPDQPRGIGVRFLDLDLESKYAISRLVDRYRQLVKMPFHRPASEHEAATSPGWNGRWNGLALAFGLGLAAGALGSFWLITAPGWQEPPGTANLRASELAPEDLRRAKPRAAEEPSTAAATASTATAETAESEAAVEAAVGAWARAWAAKDVERYLGCYAADFQPVAELTLEDWQARRRARLIRPGDVEVTLSGLVVEVEATDRAAAHFDQIYSAPGYRDRVRKALELRLRDGEWQILREEIVAQLPESSSQSHLERGDRQ